MDVYSEISESIKRGHIWIDMYAHSISTHLRIIDKHTKFKLVSDDIDISPLRWNETRGWGMPDIEIHGIELRYLWKQFKPK